jgi:hypothetical protein
MLNEYKVLLSAYKIKPSSFPTTPEKKTKRYPNTLPPGQGESDWWERWRAWMRKEQNR